MEEKRNAATSERLREALRDAGMKQIDLVRATGLDKGAVSSYLSGKYEPKQKAIGLMAKALDVSESWLWGYDVPKERSEVQKKNDVISHAVARLRKDPEFFELVSILGELPADQYAAIKTMLSALKK